MTHCQSGVYPNLTDFHVPLVASFGVTTEAYDFVPFVRGPRLDAPTA